jgi:epsilon-lactone hydrolase
MEKQMKRCAAACAAVAAIFVFHCAAWAQGLAGVKKTVDPDGSVVVTDAKVPLPGIMSDGAKKVLERNTPSEGPGAPVPLPSDVKDMAELRRIYSQNLQPNVDHMRSVFPVDIQETTMDGISVAVITPKGGVPDKNKNRLIINAPGGGFRTGVRGNGLLISIPVAATLGVKVVSLLYRQAPEFHYPAAEEDFMKVWNVMTKSYKPANIGLVGCSAGGSLVTHVTAMLLLKGQPAPGALGVYCAGIAGGVQGDSAFTATLAVTNIPAAVAESKNATPTPRPQGMGYMEGTDQKQPAVNPAGDPALLAKWPPTIFLTGTRDFAMSNALYSHRQVAKAGVDTRLLVYDGLYHGFMTNPDFPEAREAYQITADFYDKHLGR